MYVLENNQLLTDKTLSSVTFDGFYSLLNTFYVIGQVDSSEGWSDASHPSLIEFVVKTPTSCSMLWQPNKVKYIIWVFYLLFLDLGSDICFWQSMSELICSYFMRFCGSVFNVVLAEELSACRFSKAVKFAMQTSKHLASPKLTTWKKLKNNCKNSL